MNLHFPFAKSRMSLQLKNSHNSRLSLHGEVTIVALKFASSHFSAKPSLFPLFQMARAARRVIENPRQTIKCPILFIANRKTEEIEKEIVREVARGEIT